MPHRLQRLQASVILALAPALGALTGSPSDAVVALRSPSQDALCTGPLVGALALTAWALTAWLLVVLVLSIGSRLPGALGRGAARVTTRVAPASLRALVRTATGVAVAGTVLLGGTAAHADPSQPGFTITLDWPTAPAAPTAPASPSAPPSAVPPAVTATAPTRPTATVGPPLPAHHPARHDAPTTHRPARRPAVHAPVSVVVEPGDTLWHLAATALGPTASPRQVAQAWPSWWGANRAVIGEDPNLLHPGTTLQPPTSSGASR